MVDITRLSQVQGNLYRSLNAGVNHSPLTTNVTAGALLPSDQVVQNAAPAEDTDLSQQSKQSQRVDIFVVSDNVFSLYKLPNGELFSKVRNLKTGEEQVFSLKTGKEQALPYIDTLTYFDAIRSNRGIFVEKRV